MLSRFLFAKHFAKPLVTNATVQLIKDSEYFVLNKNGQGSLMSAGNLSAMVPQDQLLVALGSCSANDLKSLLEQRGFKPNSITATVKGRWEIYPKSRLDSVHIHFNVAAENLSPDELKEIIGTVEKKMSPVAQTLKYPVSIKLID